MLLTNYNNLSYNLSYSHLNFSLLILKGKQTSKKCEKGILIRLAFRFRQNEPHPYKYFPKPVI